MVQAAVLGAFAAFGRRSLAAHRKKVFEAIQVLAANFQDAEARCFVAVYGVVGAGVGSVGMEGVENRHMSHSENSEAHSGTEREARLETAVDHPETGSVARLDKALVHLGTAKVHLGRERDRSGTEEAAVRFGIEAESQARFAAEIVEVARTLDFEVDRNPAVAEGKEIAVVGKVVVAGHKAGERQNRTSFEGCLQTVLAVAAAAGEDSLASQPCRNLSV